MATRVTSRRKRVLRIGRARRHAGGERGSAIMETAMSMVIFLTFLFGIFEVALALYTYFFIAEAAREGTRYAIVRGSTAGGTGTACAAYTSYDCQASKDQIKSYIQNLGFPGINPSNMTIPDPVWTAYVNAGYSCPASPPCNSPGNQVAVTVQYNFPLVLPFAPKLTYTMSSTSAMIIAQ
jgi:Flp pilus assembly protein TadG